MLHQCSPPRQYADASPVDCNPATGTATDRPICFDVRLLTDPPSWSLIFPNPPFVGVLAYRRVGGAGIAGSMRGPPIHDATAREARLYAIGLCEQRLRAGDTSYTDVACSDGKIVEAKVRHDLHRGIGAAVEHHQRVNRFALQ